MNTDLLLPSSDIGKRLADGVQFMESLKKEALDPVTQSMILGAVLGGGTGAGLQRAELSRQKPDIGGETKLDPSSSWLEKQKQLIDEHVRKARSVDHDHPTASTIAALLGGAAVGALGGRKLRAMLKRAAAPAAVPLAARIQGHRLAGTAGGKALNFASNPWAAGAAGAAGLGLAGAATDEEDPAGAGLRGALIGGGLGAGTALAAGALQEHVNANPVLAQQAQAHAAALRSQQPAGGVAAPVAAITPAEHAAQSVAALQNRAGLSAVDTAINSPKVQGAVARRASIQQSRAIADTTGTDPRRWRDQFKDWAWEKVNPAPAARGIPAPANTRPAAPAPNMTPALQRRQPAPVAAPAAPVAKAAPAPSPAPVAQTPPPKGGRMAPAGGHAGVQMAAAERGPMVVQPHPNAVTNFKLKLPKVKLAGSIGPTGRMLLPLGGALLGGAGGALASPDDRAVGALTGAGMGAGVSALGGKLLASRGVLLRKRPREAAQVLGTLGTAGAAGTLFGRKMSQEAVKAEKDPEIRRAIEHARSVYEKDKLAGTTIPGTVADMAGSAGEFLLHTPALRHAIGGATAGGIGGAIASPDDKKRGALVGAALGAGVGGLGGKAIGDSAAYKSYAKKYSKLFRGEAPKVKTLGDLSALHQKVQGLSPRPKGGLGTMAAAGGAGALGGLALPRKKTPSGADSWDEMEHEHGTA